MSAAAFTIGAILKFSQDIPTPDSPLILAPAGSKASFLAALSAGADAVYCGLKSFSARMAADNFSLEELAQLTRTAHEHGTRVYIAFNTLIKPNEHVRAGELLAETNRLVSPDALIFQDPAVISLARQIGFSGELHLSTLGNAGFPQAAAALGKMGVNVAVLPRELSIDEIKTMAGVCRGGPGLEVFVHGALCYGISGRCYWSSWLGGKSGLRGRCVQPCRRRYSHINQTDRFFSCLDLTLDVLARVLLPIPEIRAWKIEGRKKGPHYVYYTVRAYRALRDRPKDPEAKREALALISQSLGRPGTHYYFLPQRPWNPVQRDIGTASGLYLGRIKGPVKSPYLISRNPLLPGDLLRVGYEDTPGHAIVKVGRAIPVKGRLSIRTPGGKHPPRATPVFLIDRREKALEAMMSEFEKKLGRVPVAAGGPGFSPKPSGPATRLKKIVEMRVARSLPSAKGKVSAGCWISEKALKDVAKPVRRKTWWWLPPVMWPDDGKEIGALVESALAGGCRNFVLNIPWQAAFFPSPEHLNLWAGPFCNIANPLAVETLSSMGFSGVIASPELGKDDYLRLPEESPLPVGILISGNWPLCISRVFSEDIKPGIPFASPKGEKAWSARHGNNLWIYPNWPLNLASEKKSLEKAGYSMFVHLGEPIPKNVAIKNRPGLWNWNTGLR